MAPMTTPLIEAIARAMADEMKSNHVFVSDDLRSCLIDGGLFDLHDVVKAALTAITEAGYIVVPVEPTREMIRAVDGEDSDVYVARGRAISAWEAMISAAQGDG